MKISLISFTENGMRLSERAVDGLLENPWGFSVQVFTKWSGLASDPGRPEVRYVKERIGEWAAEQMKEHNAMIFIGACGIAVRAVAPCLTDKLHDSPVLVMDEKGQFVIPVLSGHMGGANELAGYIAEITGAVPVITTATDINRKFAVDLFAKRNGLSIMNKDGIAKVSSRILAGETVTISVENGHLPGRAGNQAEGCNEEYTADSLPAGLKLVSYPPKDTVDIVVTSESCEFDAAIFLRPREYVIGVGCRKNKEPEKIEALIAGTMNSLGISDHQVLALASIDRKKDEPGFLTWSRKHKIPFVTYPAKQLMEVQGSFHTSEFVKSQVGVDNVCERAALCACGRIQEGRGSACRIILEKCAEDGMTIAVAKRDWRVEFDET